MKVSAGEKGVNMVGWSPCKVVCGQATHLWLPMTGVLLTQMKLSAQPPQSNHDDSTRLASQLGDDQPANSKLQQ